MRHQRVIISPCLIISKLSINRAVRKQNDAGFFERRIDPQEPKYLLLVDVPLQ